MNLISLRQFNRQYRSLTEPVAVVSGKELLGTFSPIAWEREKGRLDLERAADAMRALVVDAEVRMNRGAQ